MYPFCFHFGLRREVRSAFLTYPQAARGVQSLLIRSLKALGLELVKSSSCVARVIATYNNRASSGSDLNGQKPTPAITAIRYWSPLLL